MIKFVLEAKQKYNLDGEVSVYLDDREIVGVARVMDIEPTSVLKNGIRIPHNVVTFKPEEALSNTKKFSFYYSGSNGRLCVLNEEDRQKRKNDEIKRRIDALKKQDLSYSYICLNCNSILSTNKLLKKLSCKHCKQGNLKRV
ncbi:hypothetical protein ACYCSU_17055 [Paenibacillus sp. ALE1]